MLRKCPGDSLGASPAGRLGRPKLDLCVIPHRLDRMSAGQTGHFRGTNEACPRDGLRSRRGGCPAECLYGYWFIHALFGGAGLS